MSDPKPGRFAEIDRRKLLALMLAGGATGIASAQDETDDSASNLRKVIGFPLVREVGAGLKRNRRTWESCCTDQCPR